MGISLVKVKLEDTTAAGRPRETKPRYKNADLPLPNPARDLKIWQTLVLGAVVDWAGTLDNPFRANTHENFQQVVGENWDRHFDNVAIDEAVYDQVRTKCILQAISTNIRFFLYRLPLHFVTGAVLLESALCSSSRRNSREGYSRTILKESPTTSINVFRSSEQTVKGWDSSSFT